MPYDILNLAGAKRHCYGGIAQLARAIGSYPIGRGFKSNFRYQRPVGQAVKTPPFHGGNGGSIPPRVTKKKKVHPRWTFFFFAGAKRNEPLEPQARLTVRFDQREKYIKSAAQFGFRFPQYHHRWTFFLFRWS